MEKIVLRNNTLFLIAIFSSLLFSSCFIYRIFDRFNGPYVSNEGHEIFKVCLEKRVVCNCKTTMYADKLMSMFDISSLETNAIPLNIKNEFIQSYKSDTMDMYWNPEILKSMTFSAPDKHAGFWVSRPLFSGDSTYAIIQHGYYCGPMCGTASLELFQKINGNWNYIEEIESLDF
jgi:hypothetical protein